MPTLPTLYEKIAVSSSRPEQVLYRLLIASNCRTCQELANFFNISLTYARKVVKKVQNTGIVPDSWLIQLIRMHNVHPEWVLNGCGPMHTLPIPENYIAKSGVMLDCMADHHDLRKVSTTSLLYELQRRIEYPHTDYAHDTHSM